jgi:hypothetical protein
MIRIPFPSQGILCARRRMSRRSFLHAAAGTLTAVGAGLLWPTPTFAAARDAKPIPGGGPNPDGGPFVHANLPGPADAVPRNGNEPSTITDFDGFIGVAHVQGTGTGTDTNTGNTTPLLFDADVRFMQGIYQRVDGGFGQAAFGFVWFDLYQGQFDFTNHSTQIHDYNPGFSPNGVFWTVRLPNDSGLLIDFDAAEATLTADLDLFDYTKVPNARALGPAVPAAVSYEVIWGLPSKREINVQDSAHVFRGRFVENTATLAFSASQAGFRFVSDPPSKSSSVFAELGRERNGFFF